MTAVTPPMLRDAVDTDLVALITLDRSAFAGAVGAELGELEAGIESESITVAENGDGQIIGFVQWLDVDGVRYVSTLAVSSEHRGRGTGRALLAYALSVDPKPQVSELTTAPTNAAMLHLTTSLGFRGDRIMTDCLGPGADRVLMRKVPLPCPTIPDSSFHLPFKGLAGLEQAVADGYFIAGVRDLPSGQAWRLCLVDEATVMMNRANESSVSVTFASVILGAVAFLLGFGLSNDGFPADLLAALSVSLVVSMTAMNVYANTTGALTSLQFASFNRAMSIGNILAEFGGFFPVFHFVPVAIASITGNAAAGIVACIGSASTALLYQRSRFDILDRYGNGSPLFVVFTVWLTVAPIVGALSFVLLDTTTVWSAVDIGALSGIAAYCLRREETMRIEPHLV